MHKCNKHILESLEIARRLTILADEGETDAEDDSCVVLFGVVRDCAYKIRRQAQDEQDKHVSRGIWSEDQERR